MTSPPGQLGGLPRARLCQTVYGRLTMPIDPMRSGTVGRRLQTTAGPPFRAPATGLLSLVVVLGCAVPGCGARPEPQFTTQRHLFEWEETRTVPREPKPDRGDGQVPEQAEPGDKVELPAQARNARVIPAAEKPPGPPVPTARSHSPARPSTPGEAIRRAEALRAEAEDLLREDNVARGHQALTEALETLEGFRADERCRKLEAEITAQLDALENRLDRTHGRAARSEERVLIDP